MLKYEDIVDAPVAKLKTAADDWADVAAKLDLLAEDARDGMKAKADKAEWEGVNAGVTKGFIGKTAKEFHDAAAEAKGVKQILEEAHTVFKKAKDDLIDIRDHEGPAAGIHVDAKGKVTARHPVEDIPVEQRRHDPDYPDLVRREKENIASWQKKIDLIVDNCNDTDVSFKNSLEANVTGGKDFSAPKYTKMGQEEAHRAAGYVAKGRDITHTELQAFNELMRDNRNSPEFAKSFYEKLGPENTLAFFGQLSTSTYQTGELDKQRLKDVQALQENMGLTLATASHDKAFTAEWGPELRKLGTERIPLARNDYHGPFGYQLLGGIMRFGNYDAKFLNPIAEHVAQLHQKDPGMFAEKSVAGNQFKDLFNPSGINGAGQDPVISVLEALGHSPEAAKLFFSDDPTAYNEDGTPADGVADLGDNEDGEAIASYLEYFQNEGYEQVYDVTSNDPEGARNFRSYVPDALGKALEAATTGHAWDDPSPALKRDEVTAGIMKEVVSTYGTDSGLLSRHEALKDSLARMGAAYIDDLNYSTYNFGGAGDEMGRGRIFAGSSDGSERTDFGEASVRRFMVAVGADDEGYRTLSSAQQMYGASGLRSSGDRQDDALTFGGNATKVHGILDESRNSGIIQEAQGDEDVKNLEMEKNAEWRKNGVSSAVAGVVGVGSAVVLGPAAGVAATTVVPLLMDAVGGAVNTQYGTDTLQYLKDSEYDNNDETFDALDQNITQGQTSATAPLLHYADSVGMSDREKARLYESIETSYNKGVMAVRHPVEVN